MTFAELKRGMRARVLSLDEMEPDDARRLREMGLTPGTLFEVVKVAPLGDPIEISFRGTMLCLRKAESRGIQIEPA